MQKPKENWRTAEQFKQQHKLDIHNYSINNQFTFDSEIKSDFVNYQLSLLNKYINTYNLKIEFDFDFGITYAQVMLNEQPSKYCSLTAVIDEEVFYLTSSQEINLNAEYGRLCASEYERLTNIEFDKYTTRKAKETLPAVKNIYNSKVVSLGSTVRYEHSGDNVQSYNSEGFDVVNEDSASESKFVKLTPEQIEEMDKEEYLNILASNSVLQEKVKNIYTEEDRQRARSAQSKRRQTELIDNISLNVDLVKGNPLYRVKFLTLTFKDDIRDSSLVWDELSKFNKRLKRFVSKYKTGSKDFSYIAVIELTKKERCHIHIVLFNLDYIDKPILQCLWQNLTLDYSQDLNAVEQQARELERQFELTDDGGLVDVRAIQDAEDSSQTIAQYVGKTIAQYVGKTIAQSYDDPKTNPLFGKRKISYSQNIKRVDTSRIMHDSRTFKSEEAYNQFLKDLEKLGQAKHIRSLNLSQLIADGYNISSIKHNLNISRINKNYKMQKYYENLIEQYTYDKFVCEIDKKKYKQLCKQYGVIGFSYQSFERNVQAKKRKQLIVAKRSLNTIEEAKEKYDIRQNAKDKMEVKKRASETQSNITEFKQMTRDEFFNQI